MNDQIKPTPEQIAEDRRVAIHELGHSLACGSFAHHSSPEVFCEGDWDRNGFIAGECRFDPLARMTAFQKSVIGWAGYIAEHVCGVEHPLRRNPFPLTRATLKEFYHAAFDNFEEKFSSADQILICSYRSHWISFKACWKRLRKKKQTLLRLARVGNFNFNRAEENKWKGVARPDFPASREQFVQLIAGTPERYEAFLDYRARLHLSNQRTSDPVELRALFGAIYQIEFARALSLQRDLYDKFQNGNSWLEAVQRFQQWAGEQR